MSRYRKLIVAVLGAGLIALDTFLGVSIAVGAEQLVDSVVPILTAFGVWAVPNDPV